MRFRIIAGTALVMPLLGSAALASEVVLYGDAGCVGSYRVLIDSEPDLDRTDFGNEAASVLVVAGTWSFFRDDGFQSNNGPPVTLPPGGCVTMGAGPAAQFPPGLMDSAQLVAPAPGPGAAIVLYDQADFQGSYRVLTGNTPDLDQVEFDNRVDSFQVVAGAWRIFRDDGFQTGNRQPVDAVGAVADIELLGFPGDRASSVMRLNVAADPPPPPPPELVELQCPPGSAGGRGTCVDCAGAGLVVAADGGSCQCPPGRRTAGSRLVDGVPVAVCERELAAVTPPEPDVEQAVCGGNTVAVGAGCVPCPDGAVANAGNSQCHCADGFRQVGIDGTFGMPICSPFGGGYQLVQVTIRGLDAFQAARNGRFAFTGAGTGLPAPPMECNVGITSEPNRMTVEYWPHMSLVSPVTSGHCTYRLFADRGLREGWQFVGLQFVNRPGLLGGDSCAGYIIGVDRDEPDDARSMSHTVDIHHSPGAVLSGVCIMELTEVTLRGPAGADWRDAFR